MVEDLNHDSQTSAGESRADLVAAHGQGVTPRGHRSVLARSGRWLLRFLLLLLVATTLVLGSGRLLMHTLDGQTERIANLLGGRLGVPVSIAGLEGRWTGLYPVLRIRGLAFDLNSAVAGVEMELTGAEVELDPWRSILDRQPVLRGIEVTGLQMGLQQEPDGSWRLQGFAAGDGRMLDVLLDLLLQTPSIGVAESGVLLQFSNGRELVLGSAFLTLLNAGSSHQLALQFRPAPVAAPVLVRIDLQGDPRNTFTGAAWMKLDALPLGLLPAVLPDEWELQESGLSGALWGSFATDGLRSLQGEVEALQLQALFVGPEQEDWQLQVANGAMQFRALRSDAEAGTQWQVEVRDLGLDLGGSPVDLPQLRLQLPLDETRDWRLQASQVAIAPLVQAALGLPLPEAAQSALSTLEPAGDLENLILVSNRDGSYTDLFELQTNFRGLRVAAWKGAPSGNNLDGYLRAGASGGMAEVDARAVDMEIPGLFREPWYYDRLNARVSWEVGAEGFRVASGPIHVSSEQLQGVVQFGLDTTQPGWRSRYPELTLMVGMDRMDLALRTAYLPALSRVATTMEWLDEALQGGYVRDSLFLLRTPTGGDPALASATHAAWFEAGDVSLQFLPDWPRAEVGAAQVGVQDQSVHIDGSDAEIAGILARSVQGNIEPRPQGGSLLSLDISAATEAETGLDFLRDTPLRANVGSVLDDWSAEGQLVLDLDLAIGLGGEALAPRVAVQAGTEDGTLYLRDRALLVEGIGGDLHYSSEDGLQAEGLSARLFGSTARVDISSRNEDPRSVRVDSVGEASVAALETWAGQPAFVSNLLGHLDGRFDYRASLELPTGGSDAPARLHLESELLGVTSRLPSPFDKAPGSVAVLDLELDIAAEGTELQLRYGDDLSGQVRLDDEGVDRGYLYLGPLNQGFTIRQTDSSAAGLLVSGSLDAVDYDAWEALAPTLETGGDTGLKDYLRLVDVDLQRLDLRGQSLEDINVQVQYREQAWHIQGRNALLAGTLMIPEAETAPWNVDLEYLRLPPREVPEPGEQREDVDVLEALDPATLPAFDFATGELAIGDQQLGRWQFRLRPHDNGASIHDLRMEEAQSRIVGLPEAGSETGVSGEDGTPGASLDWSYAAGLHESRFEGVFSAADLSHVMPLWGHDANIVSRSADFRGQLSWPGSPLAFSLRKASGGLDMRIEDGRFVDIDSGSSRLLGAFNFDALVRRLELDFSDLYQRGFTFDNIRGELDFVDGVVHTRSPLVIAGPSSQLTITGEIDLASETIMADMLVRIPLGENISLLAGLLGAWPIAVSTYLASKIFAEQVDDFTTVIYRLEGPWADPQAGFEAPEEANVE